MDFFRHKLDVIEKGFTIIENVFSDTDIESIVQIILQADTANQLLEKQIIFLLSGSS